MKTMQIVLVVNRKFPASLFIYICPIHKHFEFVCIWSINILFPTLFRSAHEETETRAGVSTTLNENPSDKKEQ